MRIVAIATLGLALSTAAVAQPTPERLAERLSISPATATTVHEVLTQTERQPGAMWHAAATLSERLSPEQRAELIAASERRAAEPRPQRAERRDRPERQARDRAVPSDARQSMTEEQRTQVEALRTSHRKAMQSLRDAVEEGTVSAEEAQTQRRTTNEAMRAELREVLGEDARMPRQRRSGEARSDRRSSQPTADRSAQREAMQSARNEALGLTAEQVSAFERLEAEQRTRMQERRAASGERRQRGTASPEARAQAREAMQARRASVEAILTPEQQEVMQLHRAIARVAMRGR